MKENYQPSIEKYLLESIKEGPFNTQSETYCQTLVPSVLGTRAEAPSPKCTLSFMFPFLGGP